MGTSTDTYIMGRTSAEYQRLRAQGLLWETATRRVLQQAGLRAGMSCLDIGCGPGEVMRLMGEIVGTEGSVTGVDVDGNIGKEALGVLRAGAKSRYEFLELNIEAADAIPGGPFDVVFTRITLMHIKEPVAILRKMAKWAKPGGTIGAQEYDFESWNVYPELPEMTEIKKTFYTVTEAAGRHVRLGVRLPACFVEAGLGPPDGTDVEVLFKKCTEGGMANGVYNSVFPMAKKLGIADEEKRQRILAAVDNAARAGTSHMLSPLLIGAWKQLPA